MASSTIVTTSTIGPEGLSTVLLIGIVIASLLVVFIIVNIVGFVIYFRRRKRKRETAASAGRGHPHSKLVTSEGRATPSQRKKEKQKEAALLQEQVWMQQLEVLQHTQMAQKPEPALLALLNDEAHSLNYIELKTEAARLIGMRIQVRKSDPGLHSIRQLNDRPDIIGYIRGIGDEPLEEKEMTMQYNGTPLIQEVTGCRTEKIHLRMDTAVRLEAKKSPTKKTDVCALPAKSTVAVSKSVTTSKSSSSTSMEIPRLHMNKMNDYYGKTLILCQAPMAKQFADHWQAIWEQRVGVVLWIGAFKEFNKPKIDPYIKLNEGGRATCGNFRIQTLFVVKVKDEFDMYRVGVKNEKEPQCPIRELIFLHVHMWPDHRVLDEPAQLVDLVAQVQGLQLKQSEVNSPAMMLHCSLGVQRSPSFVAVYIGRQMWLANRRVNMLGILRYIRRRRWRAFAYGDPFAQVQIIFGVMQVIAMRSELAGIGNLNVAAEEELVFDREARLTETAGRRSCSVTERIG